MGGGAAWRPASAATLDPTQGGITETMSIDIGQVAYEGYFASCDGRYTADRICPECARLVPVEVVVDSPHVIGYRCGQGHKWLARDRRPAG